MTQRFEIPVEPPRYNTFLVDDYLRSLRSHEERVKLINQWGYSAEKREEYERMSGLPHGAVELALVCEDRQIAELTAKVKNRMHQLIKEKAGPEKIRDAFEEYDVASRTAGFQSLYPDAFQFLMQYSALSRRSAATFRGDYPFNNEYKITLADCSPNSQTSTQQSVDTCSDPTPGNWCYNINVVGFVNIIAAVQIDVVLLFYFALGAYFVAAVSVILAALVLVV